ncbi:MAG TPA: zf-HC2 domain-containing protein [Pyrinomonadaceae bacterium]|nr:zf-HC2 domain-containing protein [Pyrinomonadaceae bacterium]
MKDSEATTESLCTRAEDLVAYLYNEASEGEALDFERHTESCASCKAELAAFRQVRSNIAEWRSHALGLAETSDLVNEIAPAAQRSESQARKPSALAALREFFALSPVWLRAATGLTSLAICALILFAVARIAEGPRVVFVEKAVPVGPTQADVDAMVDKRVREELAARNNREEMKASPIAVQVNEQSSPALAESRGRSSSAQRRAGAQSRRKTPAPASTEEYEELARDLQLVPTRDEDDLPRLIDLIDEAN